MMGDKLTKCVKCGAELIVTSTCEFEPSISHAQCCGLSYTLEPSVADTAIGRRDASDWDEKKEQAEFFEEYFRLDADTAADRNYAAAEVWQEKALEFQEQFDARETWDCPRCGTKNKMTSYRCSACKHEVA